jgi:hypothetical protein
MCFLGKSLGVRAINTLFIFITPTFLELFKCFHTFVSVFEILNTVDELELGVALTLTLPEFMSASNVARESDVVFIVPNSDR